MLRSVLRAVVAAGAAAMLVACGGSSDSTSTGPTPVFTSVAVSPTSPTVSVGSTVALTAVAKDQNGATFSAPGAAWSSDHTDIATVDAATGVVTGVANGNALITASITAGSITHAGSQTVAVSTPSSTAGITGTTTLAWSPSTVTISRSGGTGTVTFTFQSVAHTVTWDSQPPGATVADIDATQNKSVALGFTVPGHYTFHCSIHANMNGVVNVQ